MVKWQFTNRVVKNMDNNSERKGKRRKLKQQNPTMISNN